LGLFNSFAQGLVGLLIVANSLAYGWRHSIFAIIAAVIAMFGASFGIPSVGPISSAWLSGLIAIGVLVVGMYLGKMKST
jgi:hypothetical protein